MLEVVSLLLLLTFVCSSQLFLLRSLFSWSKVITIPPFLNFADTSNESSIEEVVALGDSASINILILF